MRLLSIQKLSSESNEHKIKYLQPDGQIATNITSDVRHDFTIEIPKKCCAPLKNIEIDLRSGGTFDLTTQLYEQEARVVKKLSKRSKNSCFRLSDSDCISIDD